MRTFEKSSKFLRTDFKKHANFTQKKLNVDKLLETDFIDRFLGFVEAYDEVFNRDVFNTGVAQWLEYNNEDYDCIGYFLYTSFSEYAFPFNINDFTFMSLSEITQCYEKCTKICALLDEKRALYQEFNTFYE